MTDLWDNLKNSAEPIVLYGTGNGADKIIKVLDEKGIEFKGVFSSDEFSRPDKTFHNFPVLKLRDFEEKYGKLNVLMCFGSSRIEVLDNIKRIKAKHNFYAPDVPVYGDILFDKDYYLKTRKNHDKILNLLADDISKTVFKSIIDYKLSGDVDYLFGCETVIDESYSNILRLSDSEIYLDLGAYRGDTVEEFISHTNGYKKIYAVEPDKKTFKKLQKSTENLENISLINAVISDRIGTGFFDMKGSRGSSEVSENTGTKTDILTVDSIIGSNPLTYIKADVEGAELEFIRGAENTIRLKKPKMQIACYHRSEDLFTIPEAVLNIRDDYKIYMRHYPSVPAWDTVYYFV